jgi:hypothetical protein
MTRLTLFRGARWGEAVVENRMFRISVLGGGSAAAVRPNPATKAAIAGMARSYDDLVDRHV